MTGLKLITLVRSIVSSLKDYHLYENMCKAGFDYDDKLNKSSRQYTFFFNKLTEKLKAQEKKLVRLQKIEMDYLVRTGKWTQND